MMKAPEAVLAAMRHTNEIFAREVVAQKNFDRLDRIYTADARILPPGAPMMSGLDQIKAFWGQAIAALGVTGGTLATVEAEMAGDGIVEIGKAELITGSGAVPVKYVVYWKQEGGDWKWHIDIWNPNS
jgi:ketosteroid isomerase-like protein